MAIGILGGLVKSNSLKYITISVFITTSLIGFGCAKKDSGGGGDPQTTTVSPYGGPTPTPTDTWGDKVGVAVLEVDSLATFSDYTGRPMNNPSNVKVKVDMKKNAALGFYSGQMQVSYSDIDYAGTSRNFTGTFNSGGASEKAVNDNVYVNQWNHFYNHQINGVTTPFFVAFFEDALGGMLLVSDYIDDLGMQGAVYYRNYRPTPAPKSPSRCWFVKIGPYECRDFLSGDSIRPDLINYPSVFQRLGKFVGMDRWKALKN